MSNTEPGWYHAQGDPPGTQRYWDGERWGDQYAMQSPPAGASAAPGHRRYASWIQRVGASLLDSLVAFALVLPVVILAAILGSISEVLGVIFGIVGYLAIVVIIGFLLMWVQGTHGQSPGKRILGIETIDDRTGAYIGGGSGLGRGLLSFINSLPCYLGWLWPLWDDKKQTFTDKIFNSVVVETDRPKGLFPLFPDGKPF